MPSRPTLVALALLAVTSLLPGVALAQDTATRVAVVDVERIVTESEPGRQRSATLESLQDQLQSEGERLQGEAAALRQRIEESDGADPGLQQQLDEKMAEINEFSQRATRDLSERSQTVLQELEQIVMPVIEAIGEEGGYTVVFRKFESGILYVVPQVDITDQVIARVNAGASQGGQ